MKDWLFYPLFALIAGSMIFFAWSRGEAPAPISAAQGFELKGPDLQRLTAAPGTTLSFAGDYSYAILSADFTSDVQKSAGVFVLLDSRYSEVLAGKDLKITIRARAGSDKPSERFMITFLPHTTGKIRWQTFEPTQEFQDYSVTTTLGPYLKDLPEIYFGVWPDKDGRGGTLEVAKYEIKVVR
ncbi:MAG: hypothetical protein HKN36_04245 [Hellea sp.]|nr:hypothetical protein [Hellea sp.]